MITLKLYDIQVWDGGSEYNHKHYTSDLEAAEAWMAKNKYDNVVERTMIIAESVEELFDLDSGEIKKRALAKLTEAEKIALGLVK
jgi:hypothetical protein